MDKMWLITISIIIVLGIIFYYIYKNQRTSYTKEIKRLKMETIDRIDQNNNDNRNYLNEIVEQVETSAQSKLEQVEQEFMSIVHEKDKYINKLYKMSVNRGEILTYQLLREIKMELIEDHLIEEEDILILNNIFVPYNNGKSKTVRQIDQLIILPTGVYIIETEHLSDVVVHGLTKEKLGEYAVIFDVMFPEDAKDIEKTFVIIPGDQSSEHSKETRIVSQNNPGIEVRETARILTSYLSKEIKFNQIIKQIVYFNYSESVKNRVLNFSTLENINVFTDRDQVSNYFKNELTSQERVVSREELQTIKSALRKFL